MDLLERHLRETHPWWFGGDVQNDPHLKRLERSAFHWDPPALDAMTLKPGDTHTLRGPRQSGKTTTIKRMIQRLVKNGETRVMYYAFDLGAAPTVIIDVIRTAKRLHPKPEGPWYLFLDEVTSVPDWQLGVKVAWDSGLTSDDAIVLTASTAHDLRRGAERLPGRRGKGRDYLQLPMSFRDFCVATEQIAFDDEAMAAESFLTDHGQRVLARLLSQGEGLMRAWQQYQIVGGFPAAVLDYVTTRNGVAPETIRNLWDIMAGDVTRSQRDQIAALKLVDMVNASLGSAMSWVTASRAMGYEAPSVAQDYTAFLSENFALLAVYFWDINRRTLEPRKQRKVYFIDPLFSAVPQLLIPGTVAPSPDALSESTIASSLFRSAAQSLVQSGPVPGAIGYWRSTNDREIDFMVPRITDQTAPRLPIEVKGDNATNLKSAHSAMRQTFSDGIILSRTVHDVRSSIATIPVWAFIAGLSEQPLRPVAVG